MKDNGAYIAADSQKNPPVSEIEREAGTYKDPTEGLSDAQKFGTDLNPMAPPPSPFVLGALHSA